VSRRQAYERGIEPMLSKTPRADGNKQEQEDPLQRLADHRPSTEPGAQTAQWELQELLDDELNRLPEKYRTPLVLCYWEGKSNEEAALQLDGRVGTVSARLPRGRERLRTRLSRRGIVLSAAALSTALQQNTLTAAVPGAVFDSTLKAATLYAVG